MNSMLFTVILVGFWGLNLMNGTGLGTVYHTIELSQLAAAALSLWCLFLQVQKDKGLYAAKRYFMPGLAMAAVFTVSGWFGGCGLQALEYLWAYLIVYIFANIRVRRKALRLAGFAYAALGAVILFIYGYMDALDGWNSNEIAMVGLYSFLVFIIPYFGATDRRSKLMLPGVALLYVILLGNTDSRSCMIAIVLSLLLIFRIIPSRKVLRSRRWLWLMLLVPLIIAGLIALVSGSGLADSLNTWSLQETGKPIFNGRDTIWINGFEILFGNFFFGTGYINDGYWHNSAVGCLTAFGTVGFALWVKLFHVMLSDVRKYSGDVCVAGSMIAFLLVYCQQSVELGLMGHNPNMLPYVMLGLMLGRVRYLKEKEA